MTESIVIHRPGVPTGGRDEQGNPNLAAWSDIPISGVAVAPTASSDSINNFGDTAANGYTLYLPFGTDIRATDTVTIRGVDGWQVQGDASSVDWASPFTSWSPGTVATVRRAS